VHLQLLLLHRFPTQCCIVNTCHFAAARCCCCCFQAALKALTLLVGVQQLPGLPAAAAAAGKALSSLLRKVPDAGHPLAQDCFRLLGGEGRDNRTVYMFAVGTVGTVWAAQDCFMLLGCQGQDRCRSAGAVRAKELTGTLGQLWGSQGIDAIVEMAGAAGTVALHALLDWWFLPLQTVC
jgi:hypothetical protein